MFRRETGNWTDYRSKFDLSPDDEVDLHFGKRDQSGPSYWEVMTEVAEIVEHRLKRAQVEGRRYIMFVHGWSTSVGWKTTTARSVVRGFMRSKKATGLIERNLCIQHETVFVAKIRSCLT